MVKLALAMIVKGTAEESVPLQTALASLHGHVDGMFITLTHKEGEQIAPETRAVAESFNATISEYQWTYDFARARNFNFAQVTPDYTHIMWTDADDAWRNPENIKPTIEDNPLVDAFGVWYLYDWDEHRLPIVVHKKTMIVKNDGTAKWVGAIHEDIIPDRAYNVSMIEGVERLHLTNKTRTSESAVRNLEIAKHEVKTNADDPRTKWNLANAHFAVGEYHEARAAYEAFIDSTESDEEKYLSYVRLSDVYKALGRRDDSTRSLQYAIGLAPDIPDAYLQLGHLYYEYGNMEKAEKYTLDGVMKKPVVQRMIVFNPRDYDYNPMMLLTKIYVRMNRPDLALTMIEGCAKIYPNDDRLKRFVEEIKTEKEQLGKALETIEKLQDIKDKKILKQRLSELPPEIASHPAVAILRNKHFVKETSTGKDLVIYCGATTHQWSAESFKTKGVGGSEEAVIHLAREWKNRGWNVTVYNNCGHMVEVTDGVTYKPFYMWNYKDKQDVVVLWRWARPLDVEINAPVILVDLHDVVPAAEFTPQRLERVTKVMVKSEAHRKLFPNIPDDKIAIVPNGLDVSTILACPDEKDPYTIINTSSPDRSLDVLPRIFKEVKKREPRARLLWAYGWEIFNNSYAHDSKKMEWAQKVSAEMAEAGIEDLGRLPQHEVAKLYKRAGVFLYPSEFLEIDCISLKKAQAGGAIPITTDFGALGENNLTGYQVASTKTLENWNRPYQFHFGVETDEQVDKFVDFALKAMQEAARGEYQPAFRDRTWEKTASQWEQFFALTE